MTNGAISLILRNNTPYKVIVVFHFFATTFNAVSPSIRLLSHNGQGSLQRLPQSVTRFKVKYQDMKFYDNKGLEFKMNVKDKRRNIPHSSG
jgi:hypothetical protein